MQKLLCLILCSTVLLCQAQTYNEYEISFENAVHHEATVKITFNNVKDDVLEVRMSRSSPGRYAIHEFAKNVYGVKAFDSKGKSLSVTRPDPYQWNVSGHDGTVQFTYILFGDRGDGTYLQIDETHAHLNMPATFAFARGLDQRPIKINFKVREDLKWKVATQLKPLENNLYLAPNLQYFMDSPTEISNFTLREFTEESQGKKLTFRVALHHLGDEATADRYTAGVKKIVEQEMAAMGVLPQYDYGNYTFLACYMPQASGDGMEHRNSTYVVGSFPLDEKGLVGAWHTVSHELFHCWNVERIRPLALEPFNFEHANMSGELWFAEGFTNYYTRLFLCRAGIITENDYIATLRYGINFVKNSPARSFFTPIGMSYQAPFADAATFIDRTNMQNTFISYYTYGEVLGLALDLSLRNLNGNYSLDGYMQNMWRCYGQPENPYTLGDLRTALTNYVSPEFANTFFGKYIEDSQFPEFEKLFAGVGVAFQPAAPGQAYLGGAMKSEDGNVVISSYTGIGTPLYTAALELGDIIVSIDNKTIRDVESLNSMIEGLKPGQEVSVIYNRLNKERTTRIILAENPTMQTQPYELVDRHADANQLKRRASWLSSK